MGRGKVGWECTPTEEIIPNGLLSVAESVRGEGWPTTCGLILINEMLVSYAERKVSWGDIPRRLHGSYPAVPGLERGIQPVPAVSSIPTPALAL